MIGRHGRMIGVEVSSHEWRCIQPDGWRCPQILVYDMGTRWACRLFTERIGVYTDDLKERDGCLAKHPRCIDMCREESE